MTTERNKKDILKDIELVRGFVDMVEAGARKRLATQQLATETSMPMHKFDVLIAEVVRTAGSYHLQNTMSGKDVYSLSTYKTEVDLDQAIANLKRAIGDVVEEFYNIGLKAGKQKG